MIFYIVLKKGSELKFVKDGFNWPAFWFTWIWAIVKKRWKLLWIYIIGVLVSFGLGLIGGLGLTVLCLFGLRIYLGKNGNKWFLNELIANGFTAGRQKINAADSFEAEERLPTFKNMFLEEKA